MSQNQLENKEKYPRNLIFKYWNNLLIKSVESYFFPFKMDNIKNPK